MLDCLILGDSIAVGTHQFKQECRAIAQSGINSAQFYDKFVKHKTTDFKSSVVVISLGSNDWSGIKTYNQLYYLRGRINADHVYWILPNPEKFPRQADDVKLISISFGDTIIKTTQYSVDNVHPSVLGYKEIADKVE